MTTYLKTGMFRAYKSSVFRIPLAAFAVCMLVASAAQAALQVQMGKVNTSVGILPTNASNKWKLTCDPAMVSPDGSSSGPDFSQYIPLNGMLDNSFDPSKFKLDVDPSTSDYALGWTVQGLGAYRVTSFIVCYTTGGYQVNAGDAINSDNVAPWIDANDQGPSGSENGKVIDIKFELNPSTKNLALPSDQDQDFYQLNLIPLDPELTDPGLAMTYGDTDSFYTVTPKDPNSGLPDITTSGDPNSPNYGTIVQSTNAVPEPASASLVAFGVLGLLARRRR